MKLEKEVNDAQFSGTVNTYYAGNYIYKKGNSHGQSDVALTFFNSEEGYVEPVFEQETTTTTFGTTIVERLVGFEYTYQYKDHLGNIRLAYQDMNGDGVISAETEIKEENHYYPFGLKHKGYNANITGRDHNYGYNGKEEQNELRLVWQDFGWRNYDASIGRWMNIDNAADEYVRWSPYSYSMDNPIYFIDPDGQRIKIGDNYYSYDKDRNYDDIKDEFERDTYRAIDLLYSSGAMDNIKTNESDGCAFKTLNVLKSLIENKEQTVTIIKSENGSFFNRKTNEISFDSKKGITFYKDHTKPMRGENVGYNSPTSALSHELIHAYNKLYDGENQLLRTVFKPKKIISILGEDLSFTNFEEKYTTTLANQVNERLGEDKRYNYGIALYWAKNVTSIKIKK